MMSKLVKSICRLGISLCLCGGVVGCSDVEHDEGISPSGKVALKGTEQKVALSIQMLSREEVRDKGDFIRTPEAAFSEAGLTAEVSVDWVGPIEPLVAQIARISNLSFKVLGEAPGMPIYVTTVHDRITMGELLREIHFQARERADVVFYTGQKTIELRYREVG
jgi:defect-in-organelle-trafficking protein DotD